MKNNQFTGVLMLLLLVSTLASAYLIFKWNNYIHRQGEAGVRIEEMKRDLATINQLLGDSAEYAKTSGNKDMAAIVQQFTGGPRPAGTVAPAQAPARAGK